MSTTHVPVSTGPGDIGFNFQKSEKKFKLLFFLHFLSAIIFIKIEKNYTMIMSRLFVVL